MIQWDTRTRQSKRNFPNGEQRIHRQKGPRGGEFGTEAETGGCTKTLAQCEESMWAEKECSS